MKILDFPRGRQMYDHDCGAKATQQVLVYYGHEVRYDNVLKSLKTTEDGTSIESVVDFITECNLTCEARVMKIDDLTNYIFNDVPVIVMLQAWADDEVDYRKTWEHGHYVVAIGYENDKIIFEDSSSFNRTYLTFKELKERWHDIDFDGKRYYDLGIAVFGKPPVYKREKLVHMD